MREMIYEHLKNITFYIYIYIYKVLHITLDRQFLIKLMDRELFAGHSFASLHKATKTFFSCVFFSFSTVQFPQWNSSYRAKL